MSLHASTYRCNWGYRNQKPDACLQRRLQCCLVCTFMKAPIFSTPVFTSSNFLLLEKHLRDLGLYIRAGDLLVVASDLASELQLALACLVDQLIDSALGQEAADLHFPLLTQAVGTILAVVRVSHAGMLGSLGRQENTYAWMSSCGLSDWSNRITLLAAVRLMPVPPALVVNRNTVIVLSSLNWSMSCWRSATLVSP